MGASSPADGSSPARIVIADDHELARSGLTRMLESEPGIEVVGEAKDGQEAVNLCLELRPDLVLMDVRMPKMDGLEATRRIKHERPRTGVLMVTVFEDEGYLFEALRAGATGYVLKHATRREFTTAVRKALDGDTPLNQNLAARLLRRLASERREEPAELPDKGPSLTPREIEVLKLVARGLSNPEIARALQISASTVKSEVGNIFVKLGVCDRVQAAVRATELGLTTTPEKR